MKWYSKLYFNYLLYKKNLSMKECRYIVDHLDDSLKKWLYKELFKDSCL